MIIGFAANHGEEQTVMNEELSAIGPRTMTNATDRNAQRVSEDMGARALMSCLPRVEWLLGERGYDADWFREALKE